ncbi:MAG: YhdP family protein [Inhella sp.]|uniref:YhdP family protein n=1 Tax=Inhella sp. TaxID=1921806 RepID=UPI0022BF87B6|nr:YhdP family protein [Inhella sp.]MCZ8233713.1 YhdP family protein [Inhella sp.]
MSSLWSPLLTACHRPARWLRRVLRWLLLGVAGLWLLLLTLWLVLHWAILPNVDRWRPTLESRASQWTGSSVRIGAMSVRTSGWMPVVELRDVRLIDPQGQNAVQLPQVTAALSARSFLTLVPRLEQLYLHEPELTLRVDREGVLWLGGQPLRGGGQDTALADWLFSQHEVAIRGGRLHWLDERRPGATPLTLSDVNAVLRNGLRRHEARLDATPPAAWGERFSLRARFTQPLLARSGDWRRWSGLFYADLPRADLAVWRQQVDLPLQITQGVGQLRAWAEVERGRTRSVDADLALANVDLRLAQAQERLRLPTLQTRLGWRALPDGSRLQARGLQFTLDGESPLRWPPSQLTLTLRHAEAAAPWQASAVQGGRLQADRLDLALLTHLGRALPLGDALQKAWVSRQPQGLVTSLDADWQGALDAERPPARWRLSAAAQDLALNALPAPEPSASSPHPLGEPGWRGAGLTLSATHQGGEARLTLRQGEVAWPGLLAVDRLAVAKAELPLKWRHDGDAWRVQLLASSIDTDDADLKVSGEWRSLPGHPAGHLQLQASAPKLDARALPKYLPAMLPVTRQYLTDALLGGQARGLQFRLDGPLHAFPFAAPAQGAPAGVFRVSAKADGVRYAFVPSHGADATRAAYASPWPALAEVSGDLLFEGPGMSIRNARARVGDLEATGVRATIADFAHEPTLELDGQWRGPAAGALALVQTTPINDWTAQALARARLNGPAQGRLSLQLPLKHPERTRAQGDVQLLGAELQWRPDLPSFQQLRARLEFTERGFTLQPSQAQWLGGEVRVDGGLAADGVLRFNAQGTATADGLRQTVEWAPLPVLAEAMSGSTRYTARLQSRGSRPELDVRSSLQGLALTLPEPLRKPADAQWPLRIGLLPGEGGRDQLSLDLGNLLSARYERQDARPQRGVLQVGGPRQGEPALPERGVALHLALPRLDLDAWVPLARALQGPSPARGADASLAGRAYLPDHGSIQTPSLYLLGRTLNNVLAGVSLDGSTQRVTLQADRVAGFLAWTPPPSNSPSGGRLEARLARLSLPKSETERVEQWVDEARASQSPWPAVDMSVDDFELRGMRLGRLTLQAQAARAGEPWLIDRLVLQHPDAVLQADGAWSPVTRRTQMHWALALSNSGRFLDAVGYPGTVRGGKGALKGDLGWPGSPLNPDPAQLDGQFTVQLGSGQFLKAEPGMARLLGVLSLQSLPRRLLFDWRDVFSDGFAFDNFTGDVDIERGVAHTRNLRMGGVHASVLMEGSADLAAQTTDLRVLIVPEVNAGGASLAYLAVNPAVGLTTFLAQLLLRKPIAAANTTHFVVTGPWSAPQVDKVERPLRPTAAASAASAPSGANP